MRETGTPTMTTTKEEDESTTAKSRILCRRIRTACTRVWDRMDTLKEAGLYDNNDCCDANGDSMAPMHSGFKTNVGLLIGAFLFKWYRARFINKIPVWDRQPQWNMVITSPEQEKELHAYSCKKCGATIFIARHREWFFKGGNTECTNCGAKGTDNFVEIRSDIINSIDDDYFDYESPLDFVSAAERRKLVKQAGGDEELAKKIAIENAMKNDKEQIIDVVAGGEDDSSRTEKSAPSEGIKKTKKKKKKKRGGEEVSAVVKKEVAASKKDEPADVFDELDML